MVAASTGLSSAGPASSGTPGTVLITGASSGVGLFATKALVDRGWHVVMACRDTDKARRAQAALAIPDTAITHLQVDLGDFDSVRMLVETFHATGRPLDVLVVNAAVYLPRLKHPERSPQGYEISMATNHFGHFALTGELMPLIERGTAKRIVNLSSRGHHMGPVHFDDPNFQHRPYDPWSSYGQSKTANILFSVGLEQRYAVLGIHAYAVHPGGIETNLGRHMTQDMRDALMARISKSDTGFAWKTIPQGAATSCWAATASELEGGSGIGSGVYCEDCHVAEVDDKSSTGGVRSYALNPSFADQLWKLSEELTGTKFPS